MSTDQMAEAFRRQREHAAASHQVDRIGWTREQWVADAERLLDDVDGSVMDLLNGHVVHLIAELRALREERDAAPRNTLIEVADRLDAEVIPDQDGCVQFLRDVAEEYPHGRYMRKPEWVTENSELAAEVERMRRLLRDVLYDHEWRLINLEDANTYQRSVSPAMYESWRKEACLDE